VNGDKLTRALLWTPFAEAGRIHLVRGDWNKAFIDECCSFPRGKHDDQVDAVSIAIAVIENRGGKGFHAFD
jgi:predicted phage terminase large subunit-like protein